MRAVIFVVVVAMIYFYFSFRGSRLNDGGRGERWRGRFHLHLHRSNRAIDYGRRPYAKNIIVSERNRLIFCSIPKVACTNWKYLIRKWEGLDYKDISASHDHTKSGLRYLSDYSRDDIDLTQYYKFVFVRDPYMRLLSAYMDKLRNKKNPSEYTMFLRSVIGYNSAKRNVTDISFATFVNSIYQNKDKAQWNAHWRGQNTMCGLDEFPYDFVGKMENLTAHTKIVFDALKNNMNKSGNEEEKFRFPTHEDINFPPSGSSKKVADDMYTLDLMLKVRTLYADDFRILGY